MVRASQLQPHTRFSNTEYRGTPSLSPGIEWTAPFQVVGGSTLEVTVAQFWSSLGEGSLAVDVLFHGVECTPAALTLDGASGVQRFFARWHSCSLKLLNSMYVLANAISTLACQ